MLMKAVKKKNEPAIIEVLMSRVYANPDQPRKEFDQEKLDELAGSIKEYGVLEPIVVTPRKDRYMIIAGERRYRAATIAGLETIPARVIVADDALVEELALLENVQRQDLNPIEEGEAYQRLLKRYTVEQLRDKLGYKKTGPILDRVQLLSLAPEYRDMVAKGALGASEGYEISRVPMNKQHIVYTRMQRGELNTYNKLYAFVQGMINIENQSEIFALAPMSEDERESVETFSGLISSIERFIRKVQDQDRIKHLEKAVFNSDVNPERVDYIITSLQKIRRTILVGDGVKKAMQAA
jgi:ParB/RepB/Spo0J family partition protein